ncbi:MAG: sterol desaturase family protein [Myxococcota bacterium]
METPLWKHRLSNYGCGALTLLVSLTLGGLLLAAYRELSSFGLCLWPVSRAPAFLLALVALDFVYYWQHRAEHSVGLLWAIHAVHHQSNVCDASVSLRISALAPLTVLAAHLPLALLGLPFEVYLPAYLVHTGFVFLLHSRTPRWLDRAGWLFNSPYLHRAHHSNQARYRGKNLGGLFVVWDRLFGTFESDCDDATSFGVGSAPTPLNPLVANVLPLLEWARRRPWAKDEQELHARDGGRARSAKAAPLP